MNIIRNLNIVKRINYKRVFTTKSIIILTQENEETNLQLELNSINIHYLHDEDNKDNEDNNEIIRLANISFIHSITNG